MLRVVEPGACGVRIRSKIVFLIPTGVDKAFFGRSHGTVAIIALDSCHGSAARRELASVVDLVRLVESVCVAVSGGLAAATDRSQVSVVLGAGTKITQIELGIQIV